MEMLTGKRHDTEQSFLTTGVPGDWYFDDVTTPQHLYIETPAGMAMLPIDPNCRGEWGHPCWAWDGSFDAPTVAPSILLRSHRGEWHGYMRSGRLESV